MVQTSTSMVPTESGAEERVVAPSKAIRPQLTEAAIKTITYDLHMAEKLVTEVLEDGVDYGKIPGIPGKGLWEPGASKIMNAFECYPRHKILYHEENDKLITWAIEAEIIHRTSGVIVGAGVGACSTREPKYGKRYFDKKEVLRLGYTEPEIEKMKTRKGKRWTEDNKPYTVDEYHVENPEYGEQVNTIFKMAAKRAEVDASQTLPGVSSSLRKLFRPAEQRPPTSRGRGPQTAGKKQAETFDEDSPRWTTFWNQMKDILGDDYQNKTHKICGVKSMGDWISQGKSLDDAARFVIDQVKDKNVFLDPMSIKEKDIPNGEALEKVMEDCYGWQPEKVWPEANYPNRKNFEEAGVENAWPVFCRLRALIQEMQQEPGA